MENAKFAKKLYEEYKRTLNYFNGMNGVQIEECDDTFYVSTTKEYERDTLGGLLSPKTEYIAISVNIKKEDACYYGSTLRFQISDNGGFDMGHIHTLFERVYDDIMKAASEIGANLIEEHTRSIHRGNDEEPITMIVWTTCNSNDIYAAYELQICWSRKDEEEAI